MNYMKRISVRLPKKRDFSDPKLQKCFSKVLIKKLQELAEIERNCYNKGVDLYWKLEELLEKKKIERLYYITPLSNNKSIFLMNFSRGGGENLFFKRYGKEKCILCPKNKRNKIFEKSHILKNSFFKNRKKLGKHFRDFRKHLSNIIYLCPTHHRELDKGKLSKTKLKRIIAHRRILNKRMIKDINNQILVCKKNIEILNSFNKKLDLHIHRINKEFNRFFSKFKK